MIGWVFSRKWDHVYVYPDRTVDNLGKRLKREDMKTIMGYREEGSYR